MKIVLATSNSGKLSELRALLKPLQIDIRSQSEFGIESPPETGSTFIANALIKARYASQLTNLPALADDSGLCVDILDGAPGIYSARYAGEGATATENNAKLIRNLKEIDSSFSSTSASFHCAIVCVRNHLDTEPLVCERRWHGKIVENAKGNHGFGYDPHFFVPSTQCTAAELSAQQKNELSHRGQALKGLVEMLENSDFLDRSPESG